MYNICDFGAVSDKNINSTKAVQEAVNECKKNGGGVVYIPFGVYMVASIHLYDNTHFVFEPGAKFLGSENIDDYDEREKISYPLYQDCSHSYFHRSMFRAENCSNITFSGNGIIDMREVWENTAVEGEGDWVGKRGAKIFAFKQCKNISIESLTLLRSTDLAVYLAGCENVKISKLMLDVNIDGISPDCCRNVTISDCILKCGDDGIVVKSSYTLNKKILSENIVITNCIVSSRSNAIKLGTETNGGFKNICISNCSIYNTFYGGISFEITDGGELDAITVSNITMKNVGYPLFIILSNRCRAPEGTQIGSLNNIMIDNVIATGPYDSWIAARMTCLWKKKESSCKAHIMTSTVTGQPDKKIENITLSNIYFSVPGGGCEEDRNVILPEITDKYPENYAFGEKNPAYGIYFRHIKNLVLNNVHVDTLVEDKREEFIFEDIEGCKIHN